MSRGNSFLNSNCEFFQGFHISDTAAAGHCQRHCHEDDDHIHLVNSVLYLGINTLGHRGRAWSRVSRLTAAEKLTCSDLLIRAIRPSSGWRAAAELPLLDGCGPAWLTQARSTPPHSLTLLDPGAVTESLIWISALLDGNCRGYYNTHYTVSTH